MAIKNREVLKPGVGVASFTSLPLASTTTSAREEWEKVGRWDGGRREVRCSGTTSSAPSPQRRGKWWSTSARVRCWRGQNTWRRGGGGGGERVEEVEEWRWRSGGGGGGGGRGSVETVR